MTNLAVVHSSSPIFSELAKRWSPDFLAKNDQKTMSQHTVFLTNNSSRLIASYALKWELREANGHSEYFFTIFEESNAMAENKWRPGSLAIAPGAAKLVAPHFNVDVQELGLPQVQQNLQRMRPKAHVSEVLAKGGSLTASVDAVLYSDGHIEGPDESRFFERFLSAHNAMHDCGVMVELALRAGETDSAIVAKLQEDVSKGSALTGSDNQSLYWAERARSAAGLLETYNRFGHDALATNARKRASERPISLHREDR